MTPAVFLYFKSFGAFAEYARSSQDVLRGVNQATIANQAWGVTASYVVTGEAVSDRGVRPRAPFNPATGQWGALQVAARYSQLDVDDDAFAAGLALASASRTAKQWTVATNWYPNNFTKAYATFERTTFDGGARESENVVIFRVQLSF
jgi:phosphate-selective porin OprO/OprP